MNELLISTTSGLYCPAGDFHIDPWRPVRRAVITHAHSDHATPGSEQYLTARDGLLVLQARLGAESRIDSIEYGAPLAMGDVTLSLHPSGHILGGSPSSNRAAGEVWVVSGDYKLASDPTCSPFEQLTCNVLITESTFGLPIYRWETSAAIFTQINAWWRTNAAAGVASIIYAYSLGKAQRLLMGLDPDIGPIYCHGAVERMNEVYRTSGVELPATTYTGESHIKRAWGGTMVVAPTSAQARLGCGDSAIFPQHLSQAKCKSAARDAGERSTADSRFPTMPIGPRSMK